MAAEAELASPDEGGTRSRIRDAAVRRFGRDGFGVGLRAIGADAGVTAGLIIHHFGSKDGLRRACDEHVLELLRSAKEEAVTDGSTASMMARLAEVEEFAPIVRYLLRSFQGGGELAAAMAEHMIADAESYLAAGEAAGVIRPSRAPAARTRYLAYQNIGSMLVWFTLHPDDGDDARFTASLRAYVETIAFPAVELFTQGLFSDRSMLDDYLMYVPDPPSEDDSA
ncbi:TetR family transcriptional regulator [Streptomyces albidoflavus]|uniref:TetR/AcrR family transcriptional regulator n=1 Tax=Streptomyces albidoflavus TaxID=1886 RepID=UPI000BADFFD1|nr:TetR family transcriptional regulator [Streptomyces albidoflavus]PAX85799.1 TetR family transcriptional regulator [Streptomyces albidoflavus]PAX85997.1 TetR family transcriptional regulator [Streptomyces albidoflavus]PBO19834.1 TetR family transcriptional regulator [Streptomyces albidoflavus]PBO21180.1 TetR family transcriptional regulator [Streptomyces albidoflavus]PBO30051.1 TetR family transcriptional regulator [Streptomyces albidoflavus]